MVTDQGLFGQVLRRFNINTETLTDKVFLADNEGYEDKVGEAKGFFFHMNHNHLKDDINWWHVWTRKVLYNLDENVRVSDCKMFYQEILNELPKYKHLLETSRLQRYR